MPHLLIKHSFFGVPNMKNAFLLLHQRCKQAENILKQMH